MACYTFKMLALFIFIHFCTLNLNAQWEKMGNLYGGNYSLSAGSGKIVTYGVTSSAHISLDTGKNWRLIIDARNGGTYFKSIYVHNNKIFAVNNKSISISKDDGRTWIASTQVFKGGTMYDMIIAEGSIYVTVLDSLQTPTFSVFKYDEGADNWNIQSQFPENTMTFTVSENKIYAFTLSGFFVSNKTTIQWVRKADTPINYQFYKDIVKIVASDEGVVVTNGLFFYTTQDEGIKWNQPYGLVGANPSVVYKNRKFYSIYGYSDADAKTWQPLFSPSNGWKDFSYAESNNKRLTLSGNTLYLSMGSIGISAMDLNEQRWRYLPTTPEIFSTRRLIKLGNKSILASGGWYDYFYTSTNEGRTWTTIGSIPEIYNSNGAGPIGDIIAKDNFVFMNANLNPYFSSQGIVRSEDYGVTWTRDDNFPIFADYTFKGDTLYTIGSTSSFLSKVGIQYSLPPYTTWKTVTQGNAVNKFIFVDDNTIIATTTGDSILRMTKNGSPLPIAKIPFYPKEWFVKNNLIYASYIDSFYISSDKGLTWKSKPFNRRSNFTAGFYLTPVNNILIAMPDINGPYISKDDGNSWIPFNLGLPQNVEYNTTSYFKDDKYFYASFGRIGIYRRLLSDFTVNTYSGRIFNDSNNNGIYDSNELPISNSIVSAKLSKAFSSSDKDGYYILETESTPNDTLYLNIKPYSTVNPKFHKSLKTDSIYNFGVFYQPNVKDLRITATALMPPRPGFENTVILTFENIGTAFLSSPTISFSFEDKIQFVKATITPTEITPQLLTWKLFSLSPSEKNTITVTFKTPPSVALNTRSTSIIKIEPILNDTSPKNNIDTLFQTVVGSFDPNDKQVNVSKSYDIQKLKTDNPFVYTIRFQNTGNYPATFIRILDTLSQNLDISTLQILSSSHPLTFSIRKKGILDLYFDNINLPDSTTNALSSHGFVKYSVRPISTLRVNDIIQNKAYIYFDYNAPIITNTIENKIVLLSHTTDIAQWVSFNTAPNPTNGITHFQLPESFIGSNIHISVINTTGKTLWGKVIANENINQVDLSGLQDGLYFIVVELENKKFIGKVLLVKNQ
jgi:uncharacterized repeat protein (TIGR01451 family)